MFASVLATNKVEHQRNISDVMVDKLCIFLLLHSIYTDSSWRISPPYRWVNQETRLEKFFVKYAPFFKLAESMMESIPLHCVYVSPKRILSILLGRRAVANWSKRINIHVTEYDIFALLRNLGLWRRHFKIWIRSDYRESHSIKSGSTKALSHTWWDPEHVCCTRLTSVWLNGWSRLGWTQWRGMICLRQDEVNPKVMINSLGFPMLTTIKLWVTQNVIWMWLKRISLIKLNKKQVTYWFLYVTFKFKWRVRQNLTGLLALGLCYLYYLILLGTL